MICICHKSHSNILIAKVYGVFTQEDFDGTFIPRLDEILEEFPTVNLVLEFADDFTGWELIALWREVKFSLTYFTKINKVAVIGNSSLLKWSFRLLHPMSRAAVEKFTHGEIEKAQAWLAVG